MRRKKYDYYTVEIPSDWEKNANIRFGLAIGEARERARLFVLPCDWRLISDDGTRVKICRERAA
jgi:hypothetical protein